MLNFDFIDLDLFPDEDSEEDFFTIAQATFNASKPQGPPTIQPNHPAVPPNLSRDTRDHHAQFEKCFKNLSDVFPDISSEYVRNLFDTWVRVPRSLDDADPINDACHDLTVQILDTTSYPKEKDRINELKRKRSDALDSDEEEKLLWKAARNEDPKESYMNAARFELQNEFISAPVKVIDLKIREEGSYYAAYLALENDEWTFEHTGKSSYLRLKQRRKHQLNLTSYQRPGSSNFNTSEFRKELKAARDRGRKIQAKRKAKEDAAIVEAASEQKFRDNGDVLECQCCFDDFTINRVTHCDGEVPHFFCMECAGKNASNGIGNLRYKLVCMSGDICEASFSYTERRRFLDEKSLQALERMQQQAELKQAGLKGLAGCPFCDFAAICPPIEIDKEFRCKNTECAIVSCRTCKLESHIPLTCDEWRRENTTSERHVLEEARTAALLKKCPKCKVQILKELGCNKLTCPCGGIICDFCGKDITNVGYGHFERTEKDGSKKGCPTHDNFDARRQEALRNAEAIALKAVRARNPDLKLEDLNLNFNDDASSVPRKPSTRDRRPEDHLEPIRARAAVPWYPDVPPPPVGGIRYPPEYHHIPGQGLALGLHRVVPPIWPAIPPAVQDMVNNRIRHRHDPPIPPANLPPFDFAGVPAMQDGFVVARNYAYQNPSHVPAAMPIVPPNINPASLLDPAPRLPRHSSHHHFNRENVLVEDQIRKYEEARDHARRYEEAFWGLDPVRGRRSTIIDPVRERHSALRSRINGEVPNAPPYERQVLKRRREGQME